MTLLQYLMRHRFRATGSTLDRLIPPEIKKDAFYRTIMEIAAMPGLHNILEIGSSSGEGSTEAFVGGMSKNPGTPVLHCIEVSRIRFASLVRRYGSNRSVRCYNLSSVALDRFPTAADVEHFYRAVPSPLNRVPVETVLHWFQQDLDYLSINGISGDGIQIIKELNGIETFDAVLIDGSEFTGVEEMREVYGARYLLLDDTRTYKNYYNYRRLSSDANYRVVAESPRLRNGFAVFERVV